MESALRRATFDDWFAQKDEPIELVGGELVRKTMPMPQHGRAQRAVGRFVGGPFDDDDGRDGPGGWWIATEVDVRIGADIVRPDVVGWRRDRMDRLPSAPPVDLAPDWVCEVLSPSNHAYDRITKANLYARGGVPYLWLVDPHEAVLEAFALAEGAWVRALVVGRGDVARIPPFDAIELEVDRLFAPVPPATEDP
jgi:Uma2 family endonuclease